MRLSVWIGNTGPKRLVLEHISWSLAVALCFMIVSKYGFEDVLGDKGIGLDPSRIAAQVVSGDRFSGGRYYYYSETVCTRPDDRGRGMGNSSYRTCRGRRNVLAGCRGYGFDFAGT